MNLYFIRHAEPDYENDTITEAGKLQAEKLAEYLKDLKVDELYHSSMGRAKMTASYLEKKWNIKAKELFWAQELKWGKANGDAKDKLSPWTIKDRFLAENHFYPTGNSWQNIPEFQDDNLIQDIDIHCQALDQFLKEEGYVRMGQLYKALVPNEKTVVIVCHGGVISAFNSYLANVPFFQYISHIGVDLTAVTKFHFRGIKNELHPAQLIYVNSQAHLGIK